MLSIHPGGLFEVVQNDIPLMRKRLCLPTPGPSLPPELYYLGLSIMRRECRAQVWELSEQSMDDQVYIECLSPV